MRDSARTLRQLSQFDCSVDAPKAGHELLRAESTSTCSKVDQHEAANQSRCDTDGLRDRPYAPETKRHIRSLVYRLFELAMKRGWLEAQRNPISLVRVKGRSRVIEKVVLMPEQMLIVRQNLEDPYLLMAELSCYLGLRICEVLGLKWEDLDVSAKTLSIRRSAVDGNVSDVKSEASRDVIPLSGDFMPFPQRWQRIAPVSEEGWMFPSTVTGKPYHAAILLRRHLKPLAARVGVPRLGWHTFRHYFPKLA
jgi:integrase